MHLKHCLKFWKGEPWWLTTWCLCAGQRDLVRDADLLDLLDKLDLLDLLDLLDKRDDFKLVHSCAIKTLTNAQVKNTIG